MLGNWVDFIYFGDSAWYLVHREGLKRHPKISVSSHPRFSKPDARKEVGLKYLARDGAKRFGISTKPGHVSWNGNSGASAINLAVHLGARRVLLLGFDMKAEGQNTHWHGGHDPRVNPPFKRHLLCFPYVQEDARRLGVEILNVCPDSAIDVFPKVRLEEVL